MALFGKTEKKFKLIEADLNKQQTELSNRESELASERQKIVYERQLFELEKSQFETEKHNHIEEMKLIGNTISTDRTDLEKRRQEIVMAELKRDEGYTEERANLDAEMRIKRAKMESEIENIREKLLSDLEAAIAQLKNKRLEDVAKAEQVERERIKVEIAKERETWANEREAQYKQLETERTELERQKGAVSALQSVNEGRKSELEAAERGLERKEERLERQWEKRNDELAERMEAKLVEERDLQESEKQSLKDENSRLRDSLRIQTELVGAFDQLKQQLGDKDPSEIIRDINSKTDELKRLHEELATRPTEEMRDRYKSLEDEVNIQRARADSLEKQIAANNASVAETANLRRKNSELDAENKSLAQKASIFEGAANAAIAELNRLHAAYERPAEVVARYNEIEMPHIKADKVKKPIKTEGMDEITWLNNIGTECDKYGLHFNPRILKAFHTALKTAEWSPLTVLAGVSGTGKSELPRLYSHFGGLYFEPLSVQPNWDSQESMIGFFNSIDNKFDAQPVLRFLAQSQKNWINSSDGNDGYPGLSDAVCLVLLDEMNLAHPELYFAEFLSKLELRRGMKGSEVPFLPVKIGAGMLPYQLPLGRNVLWTGTMNQDETTKSLSDKVLDRSIIIHFPRPTELKRRLRLTPLDEKNRGPVLHKANWQSWLVQGSYFSEDDVKPFKSFIEEMNTALAVAGRAIGHRVWQSVEYYMANYPDVQAAKNSGDETKLKDAMHIAFEDQLVQKVMPKLRGIDTRGKSKTECLDKIRSSLVTGGITGTPFNLESDFDLACELGYGQFIWQTANYLKEDPILVKDETVVSEEEQSDKNHPETAKIVIGPKK